MIKNKEVIEAFLDKQVACAGHLYSDGNRLMSYNTCIAQWDCDFIIVNMTYYSTTTSRHRNMVINSHKENIIIREDVPQDTQYLKEPYNSTSTLTDNETY